MKKHRLQNLLRNGILAALVFTFVSEPILVAAKTLQKDPQSQAIDLILQGGDLYLDSISSATVQSAKLINYISVVQSTPISQLNEAYIEDVIVRALGVAEQSSIALGAVDDMADGIEQIGINLPASLDVAAETGVPDEMRTDMIALGISSEQIDQINASASDLIAARQSAASGLPANVQGDLLSYGFTQAQIDELAVAVSQRGLVNGNLNTRLAQFRATQDELADTRSGMLILAVQLLGYQIAVRQSNGLQPRATTDAELQVLAEDELRLLIHAAHLNAMWGNDPSAEIGEGDWWFIEHFAERAADRLQAVIVETQNRGLVAELFVMRQIKLLAVSARNGDADYAKAELDALTALLAHQLNAVTYYQQHASPSLPELALARLATMPSMRGRVEWPVSDVFVKNAKLVSYEILDSAHVQNLDLIIGNFDESDETNNQGSTLILTGLPFLDDLDISILQPGLQILSASTSPVSFVWLEAILTGNTDNPALLAANVLLSIIPVIGVLPDIISLVYDESYFVKALSLLGIVGSLGDMAALLGVTIPIAVASFVGDVSAAVIKGLFKTSDSTFRLILDSLKLTESFEVVLDLTRTAVKDIGGSLGSSLAEVTTAINNVFKSGGLWDNFVTWLNRRKAAILLQLGFDQGSELVGRIIKLNLKLGMNLSDEALAVLEKVADDLVAAGVSLSDEAAEGLGRATKMFSGNELEGFISKIRIDNPDNLDNILHSIKKLDEGGLLDAGKNLKGKVGVENFTKLVSKYGIDPNNLADATKLFGVLGDPAVSKDVISTAFKSGNDLSNKGPEALRALSGWGNFVKKPAIAEELAKRAGKDADALAKLDLLIESGGTNTNLIDQIAALSVQNDGSFYVLGRYVEELGLEGGYAKVARELNAKYYYPHAEVWDRLVALPDTRQAVWDAIDAKAIRAGTDNGSIFKYTLHDAPGDENVVKDIWRLGKKLKDSGATNDAIEDAFDEIIEQAYGKIPDRMKELKILFLNGYENITFDAGSDLFTLTH